MIRLVTLAAFAYATYRVAARIADEQRPALLLPAPTVGKRPGVSPGSPSRQVE